jgi:hypothetical protein
MILPQEFDPTKNRRTKCANASARDVSMETAGRAPAGDASARAVLAYRGVDRRIKRQYDWTINILSFCSVKMKVIFLDIDGVLNNFDLTGRYGLDYIDQEMVRRLGMVVSQTDADLVLSSYWRLDEYDRSLVDMSLKYQGMFLRDRTPELSGPRSLEIASWLSSNEDVVRYAILDDDSDAGVDMEGSFFQTDPEVGLTLEICERVIEHLNGGEDD